MRKSLRRVVTLLVTTAALAGGTAIVSSAPASAGPMCPLGTNWDGFSCH